MGLPLALAAHSKDNIDEAIIQYSIAFDQGIKDWRLYQNYGALLREKGDFDKATLVYEKGLNLFPLHIGIIGNYANLCSSENPIKSLSLFLRGLHVCLSDPKKYPSQLPLFYSYVLDRLIDLKLYHWASSLLSRALYHVGATPSLLKNLLILLSEPSFNNRLKSLKSEFEYLVHASIDKCSDVDAIALHFAIANYYRMLCDHISSAKYYDLAMKRASFAPGILADERYKLQHLVDVHSWNCSSLLLQSGNFERGWSLFEYGLRCPADGTQKWQRALIKPFTSDQLPLWTGQSGLGKRLLLLEEQAIGDVIMFISLIPSLFKEFALIGLLTSIRLAPILRRSFRSEIAAGKFVLYTPSDIKDRSLSSSNFDFQSAIGSICGKRFTSLDHYAPKVPFLISEPSLTKQFRTEYLNHGIKKDFLVGVSWRGGGRGKRVQEKSMNQDLFKNFLLKHPDLRFVDLQYGQTSKTVHDWKNSGIDIIHDSRIDSLKDMDTWMSQVAACDVVVSVANTTIHGSGSLNIPTMCLLSKHFDWRWLSDQCQTNSYWYPSVGISRQDDNGWECALQKTSQWLFHVQGQIGIS